MSTIHRDLRTGAPVWDALRPRDPAMAPLARDLSTDVLVIGAGISGAMVAEALAADGHDVLMVDRRGPARGSTPASTALIQFEIDQPVIRLSEMIGAKKARRAWRRSYAAVQNLAARIGELGIPCGLARRDSLYLAGNVLSPTDLKAERDARRGAGIETIYLTRSQLRERIGVDRDGALVGYGNVSADPVRLTLGLIDRAMRHGLRLAAPVEIAETTAAAGAVLARTTDGITIRAGEVVWCTGYETPVGLEPEGHRIVSTFALATPPQQHRLWPTLAFLWEASDPYLYIRTTEDGRAVIGGEDVAVADDDERDAMLAGKIATIRRKAGKLLPMIDTTAEFSWAGAFGESDSGLPTIGRIPGRAREWAVMGFGGNGITYSRIAAEIIRAALAGHEDPDRDLYAFQG